jgi:SEC-C motif
MPILQPFSELDPRETMGRNERCWCQSGQKWKHCHYIRENLPSRNINELLNSLRLEQTKGRCSHPDAGPTICSGGPTAAHTIQKEGGLRVIAENGHVISLKKGAFSIAKNAGEIVPVPDGVNRASTFPGFCNRHDAIFGPAEQATVVLDKEIAFLLSYRAISYEHFTKDAAVRFNATARDEADKGKPFVEQVRIQEMLHAEKFGLQLGLRDIAGSKSSYDLSYGASYRDFFFHVVEFDMALPIVSCGAFSPNFDLLGNSIQSFASTTLLHSIALNLTVLNGRSVFILGWLGSSNAADKFAASYRKLPAADKANAAVRLAIEYVENSYCRPSWWDNLSQSIRSEALASVHTTGVPSVCQRDEFGRCRDAVVMVSAAVRNEFGCYT